MHIVFGKGVLLCPLLGEVGGKDAVHLGGVDIVHGPLPGYHVKANGVVHGVEALADDVPAVALQLRRVVAGGQGFAFKGERTLARKTKGGEIGQGGQGDDSFGARARRGKKHEKGKSENQAVHRRRSLLRLAARVVLKAPTIARLHQRRMANEALWRRQGNDRIYHENHRLPNDLRTEAPQAPPTHPFCGESAAPYFLRRLRSWS